MSWFRRIPIAAVAIAVGAIVAISWITLEGTPPLVISILGGSLIALRAVLDADDA